jgi:hypothetical protein
MANVDVGLPIPLGNYFYLPPAQTGVNDVVEEKAMNPILAWLAGQGIDVAAEKTGVKDVLRDRAAGLLDLVGLGEVQAAESPAQPPVQTGFQPTTSVVAQDVVGTPIPEMIPNPSYVPDSAIPMEGRMLPTREQTLVSQDWQGPGRGLAQGDTLPNGTMPINMDGDVQARVMRDASKLTNMGLTTPQQVAAAAAAESNQSERDKTPPPKGGILDTLGDYFKSEEAMSYLVMGLNSLRHKPDQNIAQTLGKRVESLAAERRGNRTADELFKRGMITQRQADLMRMGIPYKDAIKEGKSFFVGSGKEMEEKYGVSGLNPGLAYKYNESTGEVSQVGAAGTQIYNVKPEAGYMFEYDAYGRPVKQVPIPTDLTQEEINRRQSGLGTKSQTAETMQMNIEGARKAIEGESWLSPATGVLGAMVGDVPWFSAGSRRKALESKITTIKGIIGFDRLQRMRDESKTGGALGQVAVQELITLQSSLGSLLLDQPKEEILKTLDHVEKIYKKNMAIIASEFSPEELQQFGFGELVGAQSGGEDDPLGLFGGNAQ